MKLKRLIGFAVLWVSIAWFVGCNPCNVEVSEKTTSPDGKLTAITLIRDCGATTSEYMAVSLQETKQKGLDPKNEVFLTKYVRRLHTTWDGNAKLVIECENCSADDTKKKIEKLGSVQITYRGV